MTQTTADSNQRLRSLDQFRGYSVAAMFVVNFLLGLAITPHWLRHNNTHFSYADSIMPSFIFACGFAYRMTVWKRIAAGGGQQWRYVTRGLGLILLSMMLYGLNTEVASWGQIDSSDYRRMIAEFLKANLWEVLAIIGAVQVLTFPIVSTSTRACVIAFFGLGAIHAALCWSFNYDFVYGRPNWMDAAFGGGGKRAWDGGLFGLLAWSQIMVAGMVAHDIVIRSDRRRGVRLLLVAGCLLMLAGYGLSCPTRFYDLDGLTPAEADRVRSSPVIPDPTLGDRRDWRDYLAEPPLVPPPSVDRRAPNYWMMDKRVVTQSFVYFATGWCLALYAIFIAVCDGLGLCLRLFEMFGLNPLAAYIIHHFVNGSIRGIVPKDSPLGWCLVALAASLGVTYLFVRFLESRKLYLRL
jgi:predicted acyltransferase